MFKELNKENFKDETSMGLRLVNFYTSWCGYCKKQDEVLKDLSESGFWIGKLDCDKYSHIASSYNVAGYPSFILFKNGKIAAQFAGYHAKGQLLNKLTAHI